MRKLSVKMIILTMVMLIAGGMCPKERYAAIESNEFAELENVYKSEAPTLDVAELSSTFTSSNEIEVYLKTSREDIDKIIITGWSGGAYSKYGTSKTATYDADRGIYTIKFQFNEIVNTQTNQVENTLEAVYYFDAMVYGTNGNMSYYTLDEVQYAANGFVTSTQSSGDRTLLTVNAENDGYIAILADGEEVTEETEWLEAKAGMNTFSLPASSASSEDELYGSATNSYSVLYKDGDVVTEGEVTVVSDVSGESATSNFQDDEMFSFTTSQNSGVNDWISYEDTPNIYESTIQGMHGTTATATIQIKTNYAGILSFDYMVSSEDEFDTFSYNISGATTTDIVQFNASKFESSGKVDWNNYEQSFAAPTNGVITLTLMYSKDKNISRNEDKVAIRNLKYVSILPTDGKVTINSEYEYTNNPELTLDISVIGGNSMYISEEETRPTATQDGWQTFKNTTLYTLKDKTDGLKTIYVWFKNENNAMTLRPVKDTIKLDATSPTNTAPTLESTSHEILVTLNQTDANELKIIEYGYRVSNTSGEYIWSGNINSRTHVISGLNEKTEYEVITRVYDGMNGIVTSEITTIRTKIIADGIEIIRTPEFATLDNVMVTINWNNINYVRRYSLDGLNWVEASGENTTIEMIDNGTIFYEMTDGINTTGVKEYKVDNIDRIGPKVESIGVISPKSGKYGIDDKIVIELVWNEEVTILETPALNIKFDDNILIRLDANSVTEKAIIYEYIITEEDAGYLLIDSLDGGLVRDELNTEASYQLPEQTGEMIYVENAAYIPATNTYYATLQNAIDAIVSGETLIEIRSNTELRETAIIPEDKNIIIDLKGKTISIENNDNIVIALENSGVLKITDSTNEPGRIIATSQNQSAYTISNNPTGNLIIENITVESISNSVSIALESYGIYNKGTGRVTLKANDDEVSVEKPEVVATALNSVGVFVANMGGEFNYQDGLIKGTKNSIYLAGGATAYTLPLGYMEKIEVRNENGYDYITSYLSNNVNVELTMDGKTTGYRSLLEALDKIPNDGRLGSIKMLNDETLTDIAKIYSGQNVEIDLNGHIITRTEAIEGYVYAFINNGTLRIMDTSENNTGEIRAIANKDVTTYAVYNYTNGKLTIDGGKFFANIVLTNKSKYAYGIYATESNKVNFNNGEIYNDNKYLNPSVVTLPSGLYMWQKEEILDGRTFKVNYITDKPIVILTINGITTNHASINTAVENVPTDGTLGIIKMQTSEEIFKYVNIPENKNIIIDLNGKELSVTGINYVIYTKGNNLEIIDSSVEKTGKIINIANSRYIWSAGVYNAGDGDVVINEVKIVSKGYGSNSYPSCGIYNYSQGNVEFNNGLIDASNAADDTYGIYNKNIGRVIINSGEINSAYYGVYNETTGEITINNGIIFAETNGLKINNSSALISFQSGEIAGKSTGISMPSDMPVNNNGKLETGKVNVPENYHIGYRIEDGYTINFLEFGKAVATLELNGVITEYTSVKNAIANVPADGILGKITMLHNEYVFGMINVFEGQNVELDLNGKEISIFQAGTAIHNIGNFKISDNSKEKAGTISTKGSYAIHNANNAIFYLHSGTVKGNGYGIYNTDSATIEINGGNIINYSTGVYNKGIGNVVIHKAVIRGSTQGIYNADAGDIVINDGIITGGTYVIYNAKNGTIEMNGGEIDLGTFGIYNVNDGMVIINGGTIKACSDHSSAYGIWNKNGKVTINDGIIAPYYKSNYTLYGIYNNNGTISVYGGKIAPLPTSYNNPYGIYNNSKGTINIGVDDGIINKDSPVIHGLNLVAIGGSVSFYDGVLQAESTAAVYPSNTVFESIDGISEDKFVIDIPKDTYIYLDKDETGKYYTKYLTTEMACRLEYTTDSGSVVTQNYTCLKFAIDNLPTNVSAKITLLKDIDEKIAQTIPSGKNLILDLNGKKLSFKSQNDITGITNNGKLQIVDTSELGSGTLEVTSTNGEACAIYNGGSSAELIIGKNDSIVNDNSPRIYGRLYGLKKNQGNVAIYDGTINAIDAIYTSKSYSSYITIPTGYTLKTFINSDGTESTYLIKTNGITITSNTNTWTNEDVKVNINYSDSINTNQYKIGNGEWQSLSIGETQTSIYVVENCTITARIIDSESSLIASEDYVIANIDKTKPTIGNITITTASDIKQTITLENVTDEKNGSGLNGYIVTMNSEKPNKDDYWNKNEFSMFNVEVDKNGVWYVYVIDNAGNISEGISVIAENIDVEEPIVSNIEITSPISGNYTVGTEIIAKVNWSENVVVNEAPMLKIRFDNGDIRTASVLNIGTNYITYTYTIQIGDKGTLVLESYAEGEVLDNVGNSWKETKIELIGSKITVASSAYIPATNIYYTTLQEAINSCSTDADGYITIQLIGNDEYYGKSVTVAAGQKIEIDLNGKTLKVIESAYGIINNGHIIIRDTSEEKKGSMEFSSDGIQNAGIGEFILAGGTIEAASYAIRNNSTGTILINDGVIDSDNGIYNTSSGLVEINGGDIDVLHIGIYNASSGIIRMNDGSVYTSYYDSNSVYNANAGTIELNGGVVTSGNYGIYIASNKATVNLTGGEWKGAKHGIYIPQGLPLNNSGSIEANKVNMPLNHHIGHRVDEDYVINFLEEGEIVATLELNGEITNYLSIQDALANIPTDGTFGKITMMLSEVIYRGITIPEGKNVEIDLNGHQIHSRNIQKTISNKGVLVITDNSLEKTGELISHTNDNGNFYGVCNEGAGIIEVNANITFQSFANAGIAYGMYNMGSGTIRINSGVVNSISSEWSGYGLYNASAGTIELNGGEIISEAGYQRTAYGIYNTSGKILINGTNVEVHINSGGSYGVYNLSTGVVEIKNGMINVSTGGGVHDKSPYGVYNLGTVFMSDGIINSSTKYTNAAYGIYNNSGSIDISGGKVNSDGTTSYGIYVSNENIQVNLSSGEWSGRTEGIRIPVGMKINNTGTIEAGKVNLPLGHLINYRVEGNYIIHFLQEMEPVVELEMDGEITYYASIRDAVYHITTDGTLGKIKMLSDEQVHRIVQIAQYKNIEVDLNGKRVYTDLSYPINCVGDIKIKDTSEVKTGTLQGKTYGIYFKETDSVFKFYGGKLIGTTASMYPENKDVELAEDTYVKKYTMTENGINYKVAEIRDCNNVLLINSDNIDYYSTLQEAVTAAPTDGSLSQIRMLVDEDLVSDISISSGKNIQLDLNGKIISYNSESKNIIAIFNSGILEIIDSIGKGTIEVNTNGYDATAIKNSGRLRIVDGIVKVSSNGKNAYGIYNYYGNSTTFGSEAVRIEGGNISAKSNALENAVTTGISYGIYNYYSGSVVIAGEKTTIIASSEHNSSYGYYSYYSKGSKLIIGENDGIVSRNYPYIKAETNGIYLGNKGTLEFYDGSITGPTDNSISGTISKIEEGTSIYVIDNQDETETTILFRAIEDLEVIPLEVIFGNLNQEKIIEVWPVPIDATDVKIKYTVDDPTIANVTFEDEGYRIRPKSNGITVVTFIGTDLAGNTASATCTVLVDITPPTDDAPSVKSTGSTVTITCNQKDNNLDPNSVRYAISSDNGATWSNWTSRSTISGLTPDTEYWVKTKVSDLAGNTTESQTTAIKTKLANNVKFTLEPDTTTKENVKVTITWNNAEGTPQYYKVGSGEWIYASGETTEVIVTENNTNVYTKLVYEGNEDSDIVYILVDNIDRLIPSGTLNINESSPRYDGLVTLNITATDDACYVGDNAGAVAYMYLTETNLAEAPDVDDANWIRYEGDYTAYPYTIVGNEGDVTIYAWFMDKAQNVSSSAASDVVTYNPPNVILLEDDILIGEYESINDAYNVARTGNNIPSIIRIYKSHTMTSALSIASSKNIILDLNGRTVTSALGTAITNSGTLEITDSKENGKFSNTYSSSSMYTIYNSKNLTISGGTIEARNENSGSYKAYGIYNTGSSANIEMTGGKVYASSTRTSSSSSYYACGIYDTSSYSSSDSLKITSGEIVVEGFSYSYAYGIYKNNSGSITISSGNVSATSENSTAYGIYNANSSRQITIGENDGNVSTTTPEISGSTYGLYRSSGKFNFYDGVIKGREGNSIYCQTGYLITPEKYGIQKEVQNGIESATLVYDDSAPTIEKLEITTDIDVNKQTITAVNVKDVGTGIVGYMFTQDTTVPTQSSTNWTNISATNGPISFERDVTTNGEWYFWAIDAAGNVSEPISVIAENIRTKVTSVSMAGITVNVGKQVNLVPVLNPTNGEPKSMTFTSSDTSIAYVNPSTGIVSGVAIGSVTVTCNILNYDDTIVTTTCTVKVVEAAPVIIKEPVDRTVPEGTEVQYTVEAQGTNLQYEWFEVSGDTEINLIKQNGEIYKSSIEGQSGITATETITINTDKAGTLSFDYMVSSEENNDTFTVTITDANGTITAVDNISGKVDWSNYVADLTPTESDEIIITLTYTKNDSIDDGLDFGAIRNLKYYYYGEIDAESTYQDDEYYKFISKDTTVDTSAKYGWTIDTTTETESTIYRSANKGVSSSVATATIEITTDVSGTLSFDYKVSSESASYDWLIIKVFDANGERIVANKIGGTSMTNYATHSQNVTPDANGKVKITLLYRKDGSVDKELDMGMIKNLKIEASGYKTDVCNFETSGIYTVNGGQFEKVFYTGANTSMLTIPSAMVVDGISGTKYYCKVSNAGGSATSRQALLTIADEEIPVEKEISKDAPTLELGYKSIIATCNQSGENITNVYYAISTDGETYSTWQEENIFTDLDEGQMYYVKTKAENANGEQESLATFVVMPVYLASLEENGETTYYTSVQYAINAASSDNSENKSVITMLQDEVRNSQVSVVSGKNITLDLNAKKLYVGNSNSASLYGINNKGKLEVIGNGEITVYLGVSSNSYYSYGIYNDGGTLNVKSGTITSNRIASYKVNARGIYNTNNGTTTIGEDDGNVSITSPSINSNGYGVYKYSGTVNFYDGIITADTGKTTYGQIKTALGYGFKVEQHDTQDVAYLSELVMYESVALITEWTITSAGTLIKLPISDTYEYIVDWDDGSPLEWGGIEHTYATAGTYNIKISGKCGTFGYYSSNGLSSSSTQYTFTQYLTGIKQWGEIGATRYGFAQCKKLIGTIPAPSENTFVNTTSMAYMFYNCTGLTELDLNGWNTPSIQSTEYMFAGCTGLTTLNIVGLDTENVTNMQYMFYNCTKLQAISLSDLNTSNVTTMTHIFDNCTSLISGELQGINTEKLTSMSYMFNNCTSLKAIDLAGINTSNVQYMTNMFYNCTALTELDLSGFNTSNVTNMSYMFSYCKNIEYLDLRNFNTAKVTTMERMFEYSGIKYIDLSSFNTSKITSTSSIRNMFAYNANLKSVVLGSEFDKLNGNYMFTNCTGLRAIITQRSIDNSANAMILATNTGLNSLSNAVLYVPNVTSETNYELGTNYSSAFGSARIKPILELIGKNPIMIGKNSVYVDAGAHTAGFDIQNSGEYTRYGYYLEFDGMPVDTSSLGSKEVTYTLMYKNTKVEPETNTEVMSVIREIVIKEGAIMMERDFSGDQNTLTDYFIIGGTRLSVTDREKYKVDTIKTITISTSDEIPDNAVISWDISRDMDGMVMAWLVVNTDDTSMYDLYIGGQDEVIATEANRLFAAYTNCTEINGLENLNTSKVTSMEYMFWECGSLGEINANIFDTTNVTSMSNMFAECDGLTTLDVSTLNTSNVRNMSDMFMNCSNLTVLDVSDFDTKNVENMYGMFSGCEGLTEIDVAGFNTAKVVDMGEMFNGCTDLEELDLSNFITTKVETMDGMFRECSSLTGLDLSTFNTNNVTNMNEMFMDATSLESIALGNNVNKLVGTDMFAGCNKLTALIAERNATTPDEAIALGTKTGISDLDTVMYVPNLDSETNYKASTNYSSVLGDNRVKPILELVGEEYIETTKKQGYTEEGVTVAGFDDGDTTKFEQYDYTLDGPVITYEGTAVDAVDTSKEGTYLLRYILKNDGTTVMLVTRTVEVIKLEAKLNVSATELEMVAGNTKEVTYNYEGDGTVNVSVTDSAIADVDRDGTVITVTGVKEGTTDLKIEAIGVEYSDVTAVITVNVLKANYSITSSGETIYYNTLQDALNKADDVDVIKVLEDVTETGAILINKDVTIDLGDNKITTDTPIRVDNGREVSIIGEENSGIENTNGTAIDNKGILTIGKDDGTGPTIKGKDYGIDSVNSAITKFESGTIVGENNPPYVGKLTVDEGSYPSTEKNGDLYYTTLKEDNTPPVIFAENISEITVGQEDEVKFSIYVKDEESGINVDEFTKEDLSFEVRGKEVIPDNYELVYIGKNALGEEEFELTFQGIDADGDLEISIKADKVFNNAQIGNEETVIIQDKISIDYAGPSLESAIFELVKPEDGITRDGDYEARLTGVIDEGGIAGYEWQIKNKDKIEWESLSNIASSEDNSFYAGTLKEEGIYYIRVRIFDTNGNNAYTNNLEIVYDKLEIYDAKPTITFEKAIVRNGNDTNAVEIYATIKSTTSIVSAKVNGIEVSLGEEVIEGTYQIRTPLIYRATRNTVYKFVVMDSHANITEAIYNVTDIGNKAANITYTVVDATVYERAKIIFNSDVEVRIDDSLPEGYITERADAALQYRKEIVVIVPEGEKFIEEDFVFIDRTGKDVTLHVLHDVESVNRNIRTIKSVIDEHKFTKVYSGEITLNRAETLVARMKTAKSVEEGKVSSYYGIDSAKVDVTVSSLSDISIATTLGAASEVKAKDTNGDVVTLPKGDREIIVDAVRGITDSTNDNLTGIYQREASLITSDGASSGNSFHVTIINR